MSSTAVPLWLETMKDFSGKEIEPRPIFSLLQACITGTMYGFEDDYEFWELGTILVEFCEIRAKFWL